MNENIFAASLVAFVSVLIWLLLLILGIRSIHLGKQRRVREYRVRGVFLIVLGSIIGFILLLPAFAYLYVEYLWFEHEGYQDVYWELASAPWVLFLRFTVTAMAFLTINFVIALKLCPIPGSFQRWASGGTSTVHKIVVVSIIVISIIMGSFSIPMWDEYRRYHFREPFKIANTNEILVDPLFGKDVGYYMFTLPVRNFSSMWTKFLLWINLFIMILLYRFYYNRDSQSKLHVTKRGVIHLLFLWISVLLVSLWRSKINIDKMVFSKNGFAFGAGYTDVNIRIPGYKIYMAIIMLMILIALINMSLKKKFLVTVPVVIWFVSYLVILWIVPWIFQTIKVSPNEGNLEREFIERNIEFTRIGYDLNKVKVSKITPEIATLRKIRNNPEVLKNIQLWDRRTTKDTLNATQVFRPYYMFFDVDADRYWLGEGQNAEYRQIMISARELDSNRLQAKTWVSKRLIFTHGYGVCLGPVNQFTPEGKPFLWIEGIPPRISRPELKITRPEIYFGEVVKDYVFVNTTQKEFDYPGMGETEKSVDTYANYQGTGGIPVKNFFRRIMLAIRFQDFRILFSGHLRPDSRIMFYRQIGERLKNIAPFLMYDYDPYIVIGNSGRLWWIIDIFVTSKHFPYSEPYYKRFNYIRNPLRAIIDAYTGKIDFYIWDENEIITKVYRKAFPSLFKPRDQVPDGLDKHSRYPTDLAQIQSEMYGMYHVQDPQTFYDRGDRWDIPYEIYYQPPSFRSVSTEEEKQQTTGLKNNVPVRVKPIYVMLKVPGENKTQFVTIMPFTPYPTTERQNMVAWMVIKNDEPEYGEILVYMFPKDETISGPAQIESRIDTNPEISEKLTLWNDGGSQVIRGNLLTLPIENSLFYVEPLYLQADIAKMPLLTQVIVAAGDRIAWGENFELAVEKVFQVGEKVEQLEAPAETPTGETYADVLAEVERRLTELKSQLQNGDKANAAKSLSDLSKALSKLENYTK